MSRPDTWRGFYPRTLRFPSWTAFRVTTTR